MITIKKVLICYSGIELQIKCKGWSRQK